MVWKKNRNNYAMLLLDQVLNGHLEMPFTVLPPEGCLPVLQKQYLVILQMIEINKT